MRASAVNTRARVRANLVARTFVLERWDKTANAWVDGRARLRRSRWAWRSGSGAIATAPPNTQTNIGFSPACRVGLTAATAATRNTACIVFNSRGLPVDGAGVPFGGHATLSDRRQGRSGALP